MMANLLYNIPDNIYVADISEVHFTGLQDGTEVVKETPFSVKTRQKKGKPVMRKGKIAGGAKAGRVELFREMSDFRRAGEIEGLSIDPVNDDLGRCIEQPWYTDRSRYVTGSVR